MQKPILLLATFLWCHTLSAQVLAGIPDQLIQGEAFVNLSAFAFATGDYQQHQDSLDLDMDGRYDLDFWIDAGKIPDFIGGTISVYAKHPDVSLLLDTLQEIRALALGNPVVATDNWRVTVKEDAYYQGTIVARFYGLAGSLEEYGNWLGQSTRYAAFRIKTTANDTLYGWLKVNASVVPGGASATLKIQEWAIQPPPLVSVSPLVQPEVPICYPNPTRDQIWFTGQENQPAVVTLWNANGVVCLYRSNNVGPVSLANLPDGLYHWQWQGNTGIFHGKLMKKR